MRGATFAMLVSSLSDSACAIAVFRPHSAILVIVLVDHRRFCGHNRSKEQLGFIMSKKKSVAKNEVCERRERVSHPAQP